MIFLLQKGADIILVEDLYDGCIRERGIDVPGYPALALGGLLYHQRLVLVDVTVGGEDDIQREIGDDGQDNNVMAEMASTSSRISLPGFGPIFSSCFQGVPAVEGSAV